jgi:hypothetical protein
MTPHEIGITPPRDPAALARANAEVARTMVGRLSAALRKLDAAPPPPAATPARWFRERERAAIVSRLRELGDEIEGCEGRENERRGE